MRNYFIGNNIVKNRMIYLNIKILKLVLVI